MGAYCLKVSVILPSYNHRRFLQKRMESIYYQTFNWTELVIIDDCSTDESLSLLESYQFDSRVLLLKSECNSGSPFRQWVKGINRASGDFVWIAESDDYSHPFFLEKLLEALVSSSAVMAFCASSIVDERGEIIGGVASEVASTDKRNLGTRYVISDGINFLRANMVSANAIDNVSACVFRRDALLRFCGEISDFRYIGDWYLYLRLLSLGNVVKIPVALNYFRHHPTTTRYGTREVDDWNQILKEHAMKDSLLTTLGISSKETHNSRQKLLLNSARWDLCLPKSIAHNRVLQCLTPEAEGRLLIVGFGKIGQSIYSIVSDAGGGFEILAFDSIVRKVLINGAELNVHYLEQLVSLHTEQDLLLIASFAFSDDLEKLISALKLGCSLIRMEELLSEMGDEETFSLRGDFC